MNDPMSSAEMPRSMNEGQAKIMARAVGETYAHAAAQALWDAGKIIVDKDELQDICNAIAVGDQASAWEKLTSMTKDIGSGEEQEEGFFGGKSIPPPWDTGS